jgi:very-short-patch-repair endonuclease
MAVRGSYFPYQHKLTARSRALRRQSTPAETKLWFDLLRHCPAKFSRQKALGGYVADFYCASRRLVVEIDGDSHFTAEAEKRDAVRDAWLEQKGLRILRFTNQDVMQRFEGVCLEITAALKEPKT